ncbi:V-type ATP synthase subunit D [Sulfolobus acidocaldarius]|uniref:A-type ATP synthase subunit D n=4 Tax=Sulfolobus acidocaldarius TaxID=2285 RepID=AATD_SULAC|nr:V-type ATP synthase subunit D [Sulfolobus acidocaldarius]Q4J8L7.1 RecName: Full=V-type ATP synthase subunit D; AltName: Full=V-ATPase subunit D [Sulfolobus acidocaldarius DSM 639]AAY80863.1 V-type ATP synthase subunit D [Sulfolobus acidocaldarius DSM 639]AGE71463.1 V-type ATP synthase subunit D [Sulfolobus acidocaldarius N8]AGE73736.1 V-type ATP synthase subunit D [Sulfolobus acidocaldarius Ron12/I]ALU30303.1 V-type ATP synthase subunit D [Sulfolobus acidocaldarius]ALU31021.1 V-type ATP sy
MSSRKVLPTKINLINLRRQIRLIRTIKRLLENKREVLLLYLRQYADEYEKVYNEVSKVLSDVYSTYLQGVASEGLSTIQTYADSIPSSLNVNTSIKVLFGVKIPVVDLDESTIQQQPFGNLEISPYILKSREQMSYAFKKILTLIEIESSIRALSGELRKTQRLINAIDTSILPFYQSSSKYIKSVLDDRTREEFTRLKMVRKLLQRRR